jgi:hypothetical protein
MTFMAVEGLDMSICHSTSSQEEEKDVQSWCIGVDDDDMYSFDSEESKAVNDGSIPDAFFDTFETFDELDPEEEDMPEWQETPCERAVRQGHSGMNYPMNSQGNWTQKEVAMYATAGLMPGESWDELHEDD